MKRIIQISVFAVLLASNVFGSALQPKAVAGAVTGAVTASNSAYLQLIHINVGQGDSTLVIGTNGKTLLIDTGRKGNETKITAMLKTLGIEALDYVIISHFDADHYQAFSALGPVIQPETKVCDRTNTPPARKKAQATYKAYKSKALKADYCTLTTGPLAWDLGAGVDLTVHAVSGLLSDGTKVDIKNNENAASVGLTITYGGFDYVTSGDMTGGGAGKPDVESPFAQLVGDVDILRVSHHGSHTSTNEAVVNLMRPEVAIISVGVGGHAKQYAHPRKAPIERLAGNLAGAVPAITHPVKALYMTNAGHPDAPLSSTAKDRLFVAKGHVTVVAGKTHYYVNGQLYQTDDQ